MSLSTPDLCLKNITVKFGGLPVLKNVSLEVDKGEFLALLGPSGCGKTTTLRVIAGFVFPEEGEIYIQDRLINDIPIYERGIGMVFQNYALFPHMTVFQNIAFGLKMRKMREKEIEDRVQNVLRLLRLDKLERRFSYQLSGGQQQRVALARALVIDPVVLLLDEPLGALDKKLREEMQVELRQLQKTVGITTLFVTHDQEEALTLSDRIVVLNEGVIQQIGPPYEIYEKPKNRFVSNFIGVSNFVKGKIIFSQIQNSTCRLAGGFEICIPSAEVLPEGARVELAIRPEKLNMGKGKNFEKENCVRGELMNIVYLGTMTQYHVRLRSGETMVAFRQNIGASEEMSYSVGEEIYLSWLPENTLVVSVDKDKKGGNP